MAGFCHETTERECKHERAVGACQINLADERDIPVFCTVVRPFELVMSSEVLPAVRYANESRRAPQPPWLQVMLLRVLQEGEFERLGGGTTRRVDVRLIAATNRDLEVAVQEGRFREDLFYRLSVFPIHLPPLRERPEDIRLLAEYFLQRAASRLGRRICGIGPASMRRLQHYQWPGNIRQLQNVIGQSAILCDDGELNVPDTVLCGPRSGARGSDTVPSMFAENLTLEEMKKRYISHLLTTTRGNMLRAAAILDVDRRSLYRMVARYQLGTPAQHRRAGARSKQDGAAPYEAEPEA
jgi:DNA-binding NtrC family response regulator